MANSPAHDPGPSFLIKPSLVVLSILVVICAIFGIVAKLTALPDIALISPTEVTTAPPKAFTETPTQEATSTISTTAPPKAFTETPAQEATSTTSTTASPKAFTETPAQEATPTETPTATESLEVPTRETVTKSTIGIVRIEDAPFTLRVREEPGTCSRIIKRITNGDELIILERTNQDDQGRIWLGIEFPEDNTMGYVPYQFVDILVELESLELVNFEIKNCETELKAFEFKPMPGRLAPWSEDWYTFRISGNRAFNIGVKFKPNVNYFGENFIGENMQFFLYDKNLIPNWPPADIHLISPILAGRGVDLDGVLADGELTGVAASLVPGTLYYLRLANQSPETVDYCLTVADVSNWICPRN